MLVAFFCERLDLEQDVGKRMGIMALSRHTMRP
jgi:hypothetical protein